LQGFYIGKSFRPEMKMGICGEHGGDPASIEVCEKIPEDLCRKHAGNGFFMLANSFPVQGWFRK